MRAAVPVPAWVRRARPDVRDIEVLGRQGDVPHVVSGTTATTRLVLKRYRDTDGQNVATGMRRLRRALHRQGVERLAVPGVVAYDAANRVLTQTLAPGRPLLPVLRAARGRTELAAAVDALAALHGCRTRLGPTTTLTDHVADLIHPHPRVVARALAGEGPRLRAILETILARAGRPPVVAPIHRDAHARQMLLDGRRIWLVDWDLAAMGDPALDVANFTVYLRTHLDDGDTAARRVVERYARHDPAVVARLPVHEALTYLRLACKAWRLQPTGWHARLRRHLAAAEHQLSRGTS